MFQEGARGAGTHPVQLPCSSGGVGMKPSEGRGRIPSLTPFLLQFPGPRRLPERTRDMGRPRESPHQSQSDTTPADLSLTPGNSPVPNPE